MRTAVDTNVALDLLSGDERESDAARISLTQASSAGALVISPIVFAELAVAFERQEDLTAFLTDVRLEVEQVSEDALWIAAGAWESYARERGRGVQCSRCGNQFEPKCPDCGASVSWRQHIIPDFLIGGHAKAQADALLTRDRGYFVRYFPGLTVIAPDIST